MIRKMILAGILAALISPALSGCAGAAPPTAGTEVFGPTPTPEAHWAEVRGSTLIATMDGIPVTIALPDKVVDAYRQGALPLGKLANAVLERCDHLQQITDARERFEQESRSETRGITQR